MRLRLVLWMTLAAAAGLLAGGCGTPVFSAGAAAEQKAGPRKRAPHPERVDARRAQAHAHYATAIVHELNEETELALQEFYQAAAKDPENETLTLDVTRRFLQAKQPERALELLTAASRRPEASGAVHARLGFVYSQLGRHELAIKANQSAIEKLPRALVGYQNLFLNYLQNQQPAEALGVLDAAGKVPNPGAEFLINLAELYVNFSRQVPAQRETAQARALELLERAEKAKPATAQLQLKLADGFNTLGDHERAAVHYRELLARLPDVPIVRETVRAKLTDLYLRDNDRTRAVEQLEQIIRDDPANPQPYYFLGSIAYEEQNYEAAVDHFSKTILLSPNFEQAYYDLAGAQISLDKTDDALATLAQARQRFPQSFVMEYLQGMLHSRRKEYTDAIKHFTAAEVIAEATDKKRMNHIFYFQIGAMFERTADYDEAAKYFEKCLELAPDFAEAQNYLGYMWAEHGINLERARELIEKALKAEPENAAYLDSMGWVLFKLEQPDEALRYILKAVEFSEEPDATIFDHLGDIYAALGQSDEAREAWAKSLSIEPNDEVQKKLEPAGTK